MAPSRPDCDGPLLRLRSRSRPFNPGGRPPRGEGGTLPHEGCWEGLPLDFPLGKPPPPLDLDLSKPSPLRERSRLVPPDFPESQEPGGLVSAVDDVADERDVSVDFPRGLLIPRSFAPEFLEILVAQEWSLAYLLLVRLGWGDLLLVRLSGEGSLGTSCRLWDFLPRETDRPGGHFGRGRLLLLERDGSRILPGCPSCTDRDGPLLRLRPRFVVAI